MIAILIIDIRADWCWYDPGSRVLWSTYWAWVHFTPSRHGATGRHWCRIRQETHQEVSTVDHEPSTPLPGHKSQSNPCSPISTHKKKQPTFRHPHPCTFPSGLPQVLDMWHGVPHLLCSGHLWNYLEDFRGLLLYKRKRVCKRIGIFYLFICLFIYQFIYLLIYLFINLFI